MWSLLISTSGCRRHDRIIRRFGFAEAEKLVKRELLEIAFGLVFVEIDQIVL